GPRIQPDATRPCPHGHSDFRPPQPIRYSAPAAILGCSGTRPQQPSDPCGPLANRTPLVQPRHTVPIIAPFGPSNPSCTLTLVDPNNRASSSPDPTPVLTDPCPL